MCPDPATAISPTSDEVPCAPDSALPKHIAIIMDGNGRWAKRQGKARTYGHRAGADTAREIIEHCARLHIQQLTLYSFSVENWCRPADEVNELMQLYAQYLVSERELMQQNNIRFRQIGRRDGLPKEVLREIDQTTALLDRNTGMTLCLAVNYGARIEITDAVRAIARKVQSGQLRPEDISPDTISAHLYTAGMPDPDLLIRTAGEMRVSNFLLWQISYAELYVTNVCWPEFRAADLDAAIDAFGKRQRRYGGLKPR
jgi:undecaprenyl diphosphate synthase